MQTQYTPGPWRYVRENGSPTTGRHMVAGARPGYIAEVRDCGSGCVEANARLIAAAPELLEALKKAAQSLEWHAHGCCRGIDDGAPLPTNEAVELAKRTIAKAIGHDG